MKTLPHALFDASETALPAERCNVLAPVVVGHDSDGGFALVDGDVGIDTLRHAIAGGATGVALRGCRTGAEIQRLAVLLSVAEAEECRADKSTMILAITDGILPAPVSPQGFSGKSGRLAALVWNHTALAKVLGTERARTDRSTWTGAFAAARAAVLLAAAAAGIPAYDSTSDLTDHAFVADCQQSHEEGFFGRLTSNEAQVAMIETIYARDRGSSGQARG